MSDKHDNEKDGSPGGEDFFLTISPPSFAHPEAINVPRRDWESYQLAIKKIYRQNERLKAEVERVTAEHERLKEAAHKLRTQLYELQALTRGERGVVN